MLNMNNLITELRISLIATLLLAVLVCGLYPAAVWVVGHGLFPHRAGGSLVISNEKVLGSSLLAQGFFGAQYFHPRPSAAGEGYDGANSGGTNWGPTSKKLIDTVRDRVAAYRQENDLAVEASVPGDAVTASASGLDPHISVKNAMLQAKRVAKARGLSVEVVLKKVEAHTEGRTFRILGEPRVNVLMLNLDLDARL
jgi:K+-transporting ATPase ATPase C chain